MNYKFDFPFSLSLEEYTKYQRVIKTLNLDTELEAILTEEDVTYLKLKVVGLKFKTYEVYIPTTQIN